MSTQAKRVLHIMSGFGGGISSYIYNKALEMPAHSIQFDVLTYDVCSTQFLEAIEATGGRVYSLVNPKKEGWNRFKQSFHTVIRKNQYDAIHCHIDGYRALAYYLLLPPTMRRVFYIHAHQTYTEPKHWIDHLSNSLNHWINRSLSNGFLGCGSFAIWGVYGKQIPLSDMMMIPNSIDVNRFLMDNTKRQQLRSEQREQYGITSERPVIGHIGRFVSVKNHSFIIEMAKRTQHSEKWHDWLFCCIGDGDLKERIQQRVHAENLTQRIMLLDRSLTVEKTLAMYDCLILPSFYEGLPTVVIEAQAAGIPVVLSDVITHEVDLDLEMMHYVSLDTGADHWLSEIETTLEQTIPATEVRLQRMNEKGFTNESSAQIFADFVFGKIHQHQIK